MKKEIIAEIIRTGNKSGVILELPANAWDLEDAMEQLQIPENQGYQVRIRHVPHFPKELLLSDPTLDELNFLAERLAGMDEAQRTILEGLTKIESSRFTNGQIPVSELINLTYNLDACCITANVGNDRRLGMWTVESGEMDVPEALVPLLDYAQVGKEKRERENGVFVQGSYVTRSAELHQRYNGAPPPLEPMSHTIELDLSGPYEKETIRLPCGDDVLWNKLMELGRENPANCKVTAFRSRVPICSDDVFDISRIQDVNELAGALAEMAPENLRKYKALVERKEPRELDTLLGLTRKLDRYELQPGMYAPADYARTYLEQKLGAQEAREMEGYTDLESYGRDLMRRDGIARTAYGLLRERGQKQRHLETLRFYNPLVICQEPLDENGEPTNRDYEPISPDFNLLSCMDIIRGVLEQENSHLDPVRGLMEFYDGSDAIPSVQEKVQSLFFSIEEHGDSLWGVTEATISAPLTEVETASLLDFASGQMSDGQGEGFEQRPIQTPEGKVFVSLWNPDNFRMIPEAEFDPEQFRYYDYSGGMKLC